MASPRHFGHDNCVVLPLLSLIPPSPLLYFFFNPKPLKAVVLIDVIAFLVFFLVIPSPISKMGEGLRRRMVEGEAIWGADGRGR